MEGLIMKKLISLAAALALLVSCPACSKEGGAGNDGAAANRDGMEKISIEVESSSGDVTASMWYPTDTGIVYYDGDYESMAFFTDETDGYEIMVEVYADNGTDCDYLGESYSKTTLGKYSSYMREEDELFICYVILGTKGEETVYLEMDVYPLYDASVDLNAVMASDEIMAIVDSIEYK